MATTIAGFLGVGVHWIAGHCGEKYEPIVTGASVFIFGELISSYTHETLYLGLNSTHIYDNELSA